MVSWKIGDKAYCIKKGAWSGGHAKVVPIYGITYLVDGFKMGRKGLQLFLAGFDEIALNGKRYSYMSIRFRKIVPQCDQKEEELENKLKNDSTIRKVKDREVRVTFFEGSGNSEKNE